MHTFRFLGLAILMALLSACSTTQQSASTSTSQPKNGGYYLDDGPDAIPPSDLDKIPDATPKIEPIIRATTRPYTVLGTTYTPYTDHTPYRTQGIASWYGKKYHGQKTSSGEVYDMYAMTAAHPILPIPSYVRVTRVSTGKSVVVRVNDRGPFLRDRVIDLSYTAAHKLGIIGSGSGEVLVEALLPDDIKQLDRSVSQTYPVDNKNTTPSNTKGFYVQAGVFGDPNNAEALKQKIILQRPSLTAQANVVQGNNLHRVHFGPYLSKEEAQKITQQLLEINQDSVLVYPN